MADDAAVYQVNRQTALVATVDFFAPVVDDPYTYGAIAAANAMSDVFAMGGEVLLALNVAAFPEDLPPAVTAEILRGGAEKVREAGGVIAGGHTVWDVEPKYGLSVIGKVRPSRIFRKNGLKPGDVLFLTKALGTGAILSATKQGRSTQEALDAAIESMLRLNRHTAHVLSALGVRAATDVTGFGLLGHLWEMTSQSGVQVELRASALPAITGAMAAFELGVETGGGGRNREWVGENLLVDSAVTIEQMRLAFDPQTSGGLLFALPRRKADAARTAFEQGGLPLWEIGSVHKGDPGMRLSP